MTAPAFDQGAALGVLAAWADELAAPTFEAGAWHPTEQGPDGAWSMPWWEASPRMHRFLQDISAAGWVTPEVDWPTWARTDEAERLRSDRSALAAAGVDDLRRLLTTVVRADRFSEGTIAQAAESGLLAAVAARAAALARQEAA